MRSGDERRTYVLDTCVLLADPSALFRFEEHDVVLPLVVIEELDRKKTLMDEVGANARRAIRLLEEYGASRPGGMSQPVTLPSGGSLRIELNGIHSELLPEVLDPKTPDHRILSTCLGLVAAAAGETVLVTKDAALRIKAAQLGVPVQDYRADTVTVDESYSGVTEIEVDGSQVDRLYVEGKITLDSERPLFINQFVVLHGPGSQSAIAQVAEVEPRRTLVRVPGNRRVFGVESRTCARPSPWSCCSIRTFRRSRSWGLPARARPSWRWRRASSKSWKPAATARSRCIGP